MKSIILAAGVSSRLRPITDNIPKTLLQVGSKPILAHIVDSLIQNGVKKIIICIGYRGDQIIQYCKKNYPHLEFMFVKNENYNTTNNLYSLYLAREHFDDEIILFNGDSIHDPKIVSKMINQTNSSMAIDSKSYHEESMKILMEEGKIVKMSKKISENDSSGASVDIFRIAKNDVTMLKEELIKIIEGKRELNHWIETAFENLFKTGKINAIPIDISGNNWYEIDTKEDLKNARELFSIK